MIEKSIYYHKYKKYKKKYLHKKKNMSKDDFLTPSNFYFTHGTLSIDTLFDILKDGFIRPGKDVPEKNRVLGGTEIENDKIYMNIYFPDTKNLNRYYLPYTFLLHPKLLLTHDAIFSKRYVPTIEFNNNDDITTFENKLNEMKDIIANPSKDTPEILLKAPEYLHEITVDQKISLKDYLIGIVCSACDKQTLTKIKKIVGDDIILIRDQYQLYKF